MSDNNNWYQLSGLCTWGLCQLMGVVRKQTLDPDTADWWMKLACGKFN